MRSLFFGKNKKKGDEEDEGKTVAFSRKTATYFPVSQEENWQRKRRMVVNSLLELTLNEEIEIQLLLLVSKGFDLPLVIGEQFICKLPGKMFQSASYNDCLQYILTTLAAEDVDFAIAVWETLVSQLDKGKQLCQLCLHGFEQKTRTWRFKEYKNCFVGHEAVSWLLDNNVCKSRQEAVAIGQQWIRKKYIEHVSADNKQFDDALLFYRFNDLNAITQQKDASKMIDDKSNKLGRYNTSEFSDFQTPPHLKQTPSNTHFHNSAWESTNKPMTRQHHSNTLPFTNH